MAKDNLLGVKSIKKKIIVLFICFNILHGMHNASAAQKLAPFQISPPQKNTNLQACERSIIVIRQIVR